MRRNVLLPVIIGVGAVVLVVSLAGSGRVWKDLRHLDLEFILLLFLNFLVVITIDALRTCILLEKISFKTCLSNSLWGFYASTITPFAAGGQPFQIYHLVKSGVPFEKAASVIAVRFFSSFSFTVVSGFFFFLLYLDTFRSLGILGDLFFIGIVLAFAFYVFIMFLSFSRRFLEKFFLSRFVMKIIVFFSKKSKEEVEGLIRERILSYISTMKKLWRSSRTKTLITIALSGAMITAIHTSTYLSMKAVNPSIEVSLFQIITIQLALSLVVYFVPTPGASGAVEIVYYVVYSNLIRKTDAVTSLLIWRFFNYYLFIILGIILGIGGLTKKPEEKSSG
ncbi:lysylphosphatidylglycerol synthase transmembrane domain-containing protein [Thermotoga sp. SG1]|uniref:lysylphosphatidylglycerol synthase transmembrane domain-containing protein n=1 Tax=Thermotoga sp. SG1 TaxID=126739 RepID=UPI000C7728B4|nr:lysylphosphatidylglycerol synthase transmembrane domain-containing protein [Thermotoga sp. SG1]PLV56367.1 hypothetical protein AS006_07420 [Thermotoga sp. SG1]